MARHKRLDEPLSSMQQSFATTPEQREQELIGLAMDLAQRRMQEGTASSAEIVHFLKLGSSRERLEQEKILAETEKARAQAKATQDLEDTKRLMTEAIAALRTYRGETDEEYYDDAA